jgi:hypothetical protein
VRFEIPLLRERWAASMTRRARRVNKFYKVIAVPVLTSESPEDDRAVTMRVSQIVSLEVANRPAA